MLDVSALLQDSFKPVMLRHAAQAFDSHKPYDADFVFSSNKILLYHRPVSCAEIWYKHDGVTTVRALSLDNNQIYPMFLPVNVPLMAAVEALGFEALHHVIAEYSSGGCRMANSVIINVGRFHVECALVDDNLRLFSWTQRTTYRSTGIISVPLADSRAFEELRVALLERASHA